MKSISSAVMRRFVKAAGDRLTGDWVVIGGAVLPLCGIDRRVTVDIDVAGPASATQADMLVLMEICASLGLPIEAVNQAGAYFLHKIPNWQKSLVEVHRGKTATIHRPDVNLFVRLKLARLSETDLEDCWTFLQFARKQGEPIDQRGLAAASKQALKTAQTERAARLNNLLSALS
jgi:hypothetical protein